MAVSFNTSSVSASSASEASFTWSHGGASSGVKGATVFVWTNANEADITSVTYGGVAMSARDEAADTAGEPGRCTVFHLGAGVPQGTQNVVVTRVNNATVMYGVCITELAASDTTTCGHVKVTGDAAVSESAVDDGSITGANSLRLAGGHFGHQTPPTAGANSTVAQSIDIGAQCFVVAYETTPGTGSRSVGMSNATSDDRAIIHLAVREVATFHVSASGSDSNVGSSGSPWATVRKASRTLSPGDTCIIHATSSAATEFVETAGPSIDYATQGPAGYGASWSEKISFAAASGDEGLVTIKRDTATGSAVVDLRAVAATANATAWQAQFIELRNLKVSGYKNSTSAIAYTPIYVNNVPAVDGAVHDIRVYGCETTLSLNQGCLIEGHASDADGIPYNITFGKDAATGRKWKSYSNGTTTNHHGLYCQGRNCTFEDGEVYSNPGLGIQIHRDSPLTDHCRDNTINRCIAHDNGQSGIYYGGSGDNGKIWNCLAYDNGTHGIRFDDGANSGQIYNCTSARNTTANFTLGSTAAVDGTAITNCVARKLGVTTTNLQENASTNTTITTCINVALTDTDATDPLFTDPSTDDFTLQATSPCKDAGTNLTSSGVTIDLIGTSRPQGNAFDIGAYERLSSDITVGATGVGATTALGTVGIALVVAASGLFATGNVGTATGSAAAAENVPAYRIVASPRPPQLHHHRRGGIVWSGPAVLEAPSGNVTVGASGVEAVGAVGTATVSGSQAGPNVPSYRIVSSARQGRSERKTNAETSWGAMSFAESPDVTVGAAGVQATTAVGTATGVEGLVVAATGVQATGQVGSGGISHSQSATGVQATGQVGTATPSGGGAKPWVYRSHTRTLS